MDFNKKYILNKEYSIYYDIDRYLIGSSNGENELFFVPLHPMYAKFFSYFDGKQTLKTIVKESAEKFSADEKFILKLLSALINNNKELTIKYDDSYFIIPENIIVEAKEGESRTDLSNIKNLQKPLNLIRRRLSIPKSILYVVNTQCITDCTYCYADKNTPYKTLSTERILEIIDEAHYLGIIDFDISGGELFLHKDWDKIVKKCKEYGYLTAPSTKVPLKYNYIDQFRSLGLDTIQVSLDSTNAAVLRNTLNVNTEYCTKIMNSIRYMDSQGINLIIKGTQTKYTCDVENIRNVMNFISELKNVKRYTVSIVGYSHNKTIEDFNNFRPTKKQIEELETFLNKAQSTVPYEIVFDKNIACSSNIMNPIVFNNRALCTGNVYGFVLLPNGKVTICEELYWNPEFIIGDLSNNNIMEMWHSERAMNVWDFQQDRLSDNNACKRCVDFNTCRKGLGVCWKSVIAHYGKQNSHYPDPSCPKAPVPLYEVYYNDI